jgi:hypothetical protein
VGPQWGQSFSCDGWGNLTGMSVVKGSAPTMSTTADPATNRLNAWTYDANGNATSIPGVGNLAYGNGTVSKHLRASFRECRDGPQRQ